MVADAFAKRRRGVMNLIRAPREASLKALEEVSAAAEVCDFSYGRRRSGVTSKMSSPRKLDGQLLRTHLLAAPSEMRKYRKDIHPDSWQS